MVEKEMIHKENYENFLCANELDKYNQNNKECTLFITRNGKRTLWKAQKLNVPKTSYLGQVL